MCDKNSNINESLTECIDPCDDGDVSDAIPWSLADLPDVILVRIMKFLNLKDRYHLSTTCHRLYEFFTHPDLWKVAHIYLLVKETGVNRFEWADSSIMTFTMSEIVKRFSHLFQHLYLQTPSTIKQFDKAVINMLQDLAQECRLESLTLSVGILESKDRDIQFERNFFSNTKDVHFVTALLYNAVRLKHLNIISWPLHANSEENDIFRALVSNEKLTSLESLSLFYIDKKQQWTGRVPNLPEPEQITKVFSFLPNLTHISLRSPMINDDVIQLLASEKRRSLKVLEVLVMWSRATSGHVGCKIPDISGRSWLKLKTVSPHIKVEFVIHIRIPFEELIVMLKPEVPLSSLMILKYGQCGSMLIDSITSKYTGSLTSFVSLCDSDNCDNSLLNLMKECKYLNNFVYHGGINYKTVMQMAELAKDTEREMKSFEFKEQSIKTDNLHEGDEDDDVVIRRDNETQEYVLAAIQSWHFNEENHQRKLDLMSDFVKDIFGHSWTLYKRN